MKKLVYFLLSVLLLAGSFCPCLAYGLTKQDAQVSLEAPSTENVFSQREWKFALVGSNATGTITYNDNGSVTMTSTASGGKFADSEEGFLFYYTEIDAETENFTISAHFNVDDANSSDNQSAFGTIVVDTVGERNVGKYMNYAAAGCFKLAGDWSGYKVPGARFVTGYLDPTAQSAYDANNMSARVMDNKKGFEPAQSFITGSNMDFTVRKSNTGYHASMVQDRDHEYILYGPEKLLVQDENKVYAGFFVARNITVTVSNMFISITHPDDDDPAEKPVIDESSIEVNFYSPMSTSTLDFNCVLRANMPGTYSVKGPGGLVYFENEHADALQYFEKIINFADTGKIPCDYPLEIRFTPDPLEDNTVLATQLKRYTITYDVLGEEGDTFFVSPDASINGIGTRDNPITINKAARFARPGQTFIILNGTYAMTSNIRIMRGINGTAEKPITLMAETPGQVILDYENSGLTSNEALLMGGDYWYVYGLIMKGNQEKIKGIRISGNHNVLEMCDVSRFGGSGVQISGSSYEPFEKWPSYNFVKNCDSYNNCDAAGQDADGFGVKLTVGDGNKLYGCVAHHNIDDGFDLYAKSTTGPIGKVVIENCVAYCNGFVLDADKLDMLGEGNGFKLGGESMVGAHELINSISYGNAAKGITSNSGPNCIVRNCTSFNNSVRKSTESFSLYTHNPNLTTEYVVEGLLSLYDNIHEFNTKSDRFALQGQSSLESVSNYIWKGTFSANSNGNVASASWFENVDIDNIVPTRNADGSIDMHNLLTLKASAPSDTGARLVTTGIALSTAPTYDPSTLVNPEGPEDPENPEEPEDPEEPKDPEGEGGGACATIAPTSGGNWTGTMMLFGVLAAALIALLSCGKGKAGNKR